MLEHSHVDLCIVYGSLHTINGRVVYYSCNTDHSQQSLKCSSTHRKGFLTPTLSVIDPFYLDQRLLKSIFLQLTQVLSQCMEVFLSNRKLEKLVNIYWVPKWLPIWYTCWFTCQAFLTILQAPWRQSLLEWNLTHRKCFRNWINKPSKTF